jgi:hypothetical protein
MGGNETDGYPDANGWDGETALAAVVVRIGIRIHWQPAPAGRSRTGQIGRVSSGSKETGRGRQIYAGPVAAVDQQSPTHSEFLKHQPVFLSPIQAILERQALDDLKKILKKKRKEVFAGALLLCTSLDNDICYPLFFLL